MKIYKSIILLFLTIMTLAGVNTACQELPLIGDLAGQWQITSITYPDGQIKENPQTYYCFYRHTAQLTAPNAVKITANMIYDNPSLTLDFPDDNPAWKEDWGILAPEDNNIENLGFQVHYTILKLTDKHLEMVTDQGVTIILRKY